MYNPLITCICPTYKRPEHLANSVKLFLMQKYENKRLIVLDDAGQHENLIGNNFTLISTTERYKTLPKKFNALVNYGMSIPTDIFALWEDDDIYLPNHLTQIAEAYKGGEDFIVPEKVYSTHGQEFGNVQMENAGGRFHSSWAFSSSLFSKVGGYPVTNRLIFDQEFGRLCSQHGTIQTTKELSFVYHWGNGEWHGSQAGDSGFQKLWDDLGKRPFQKVECLTPKLNKKTEKILNNFGLI